MKGLHTILNVPVDLRAMHRYVSAAEVYIFQGGGGFRFLKSGDKNEKRTTQIHNKLFLNLHLIPHHFSIPDIF